MKIGSLFSGYGGLDAAVVDVLGGEVVWHCEWDDAPARILAHHFPTVPNYRDVSKVDWSAVERVDILTGGFPCQDVSLAGRRAGMKDGTRSGLWSEFATAIDVLRPRLVVIENVRGLLSAAAGNDVEPCAWCLGDDSGEPALRALGAVLGELADLGYDAEWAGVRASDVGAPHGRFRVFIVAYAGSGKPERWGRSGAVGGASRSSSFRAGERERVWDAPVYIGADVADSGRELGGERWPTTSGEAEGGRSFGVDRGLGARVHDATSADTDCGGLERFGRVEPVKRDLDGRDGTDTTWGDYEPAIRRWESVTGRVAPAPTLADGKNGQHRLSAPFVEWMMGLPEGWVTSSQIGLTRNQQLRSLGNGVVPQQASYALRTLLGEVVSVGREL